jgi:CBS domain containing-hemolysin-like protein
MLEWRNQKFLNMEKTMKTMNILALDNVDHLVQPENFNDLTLQTSALTIFTDFKQHQPQVIEGDTPAFRTRYLMRKSHSQLKLVIDRSEELIGIISLKELNEQNFMLQQAKGISRDDIQVRDLMVPRMAIKALNYQQLQNATIGDVIETLKQNRQQYCLVLDVDQRQIRGIISAADIAMRLHIPLEIDQPDSFLDIFRAMRA